MSNSDGIEGFFQGQFTLPEPRSVCQQRNRLSDRFFTERSLVCHIPPAAALRPLARVGIAAIVTILLLEPGNLRLQGGEGCRHLGGCRLRLVEQQVVLLGRISLKVEQFPGVLLPVMDQLVAGRANAVVSPGVVVAGIVIVAIVDRLPPAGRGLAP